MLKYEYKFSAFGKERNRKAEEEKEKANRVPYKTLCYLAEQANCRK